MTQGGLVAPGDRGFLAAALSPGMRAITVPVNANTAVAGFVFPGDRVDLLMTHDAGGLKATETILRNLRVLATDQSTSQNTVDGRTSVRAFSTVTLEVTPKIAEKISVAQTVGTLSLSLRPIADSASDLERALASGNISIPDDATPEEEARLLARARATPSDSGSSYAIGADVSRFATRTIQRDGQPQQAQQAQQAPNSEEIRAILNQQGIATAPAAPKGPTVQVTRGGQTSQVAVGQTGTVKTSTAKIAPVGQ